MNNLPAPRHRLIVFIALGLVAISVAILIGLFCVFYYFEPTASPKNIFITNKTDHQVNISWTTEKATRGVILISEDNKFPLLPILVKNLYKDDGEKNINKVGYYTTHYVTVGSLKPNKIYQFRVYQGLRNVFQGSFSTGSMLANLPSPNPIYGRVLKADGKTPVAGSIVYFQAKEASSSSALLSALTNTEGRWSIDLGNLRTLSYRKNFPMGKKTRELLIIEAGDKGRVKSEAFVGLDKPWPDIVLKAK